jgi:myo-inositol-1(or 4)-monophosphatase
MNGSADRLPADGAADARLALALALAPQAGRLATSIQAGQAGRAVRFKGPGNRVTDADLLIQSGITAAITRSFPRDGILAEEGDVLIAAEREFVWVVDPLDGTNNYALGIPCFTISLAVFNRGEPYAGVVHDPNTGFRCWALRAHGAYANDRRLTLVPRALDPTSNISVRVPVEADLEPLVSRWLREYKFRGFGSVALHLAFAALGAIDLVQDHKARLWDLAAGAAVLLEAGGCITTPAGRPLFPFDVTAYRGSPVPFLAGNPLAHAAATDSCRALAQGGVPREW